MAKLDTLVFPLVIINALLVKSLLLTVGINNSVIFLACFFLMIHLSLTTLMYYQIREYRDTFVSKMESSAFVAVISTLVALFGYTVLSALPFLKLPFFFLKLLPWSSVWGDLSIVSIPVFVSHVTGRLIISKLLE
jgi:hypothetical protein